MRVALVQVRIESPGRSANLARVMNRLVQVVQTVPAPDLVVLPAGCDGSGRDDVTPAMIQGFGESLAAVAREWGVYVAGAFLEDDGGTRFEQARLYDPDGDVIGRSQGRGDTGSVDVCKTPLGRIALRVDIMDRPAEAPAAKCDLVLVHGRWAADHRQAQVACGQVRERMADLARRSASAVCAVGPVGAAPGSPSQVLIGAGAVHAADGACLLSLASQVDAIEAVDLDLAAASPSG